MAKYINNKLDKSFGPAGSSAGIFIFVVGIGMCFFTWWAIVALLLGAFVGFSYSGSLIHEQDKRFCFYNYFLGFIPIGKCLKAEAGMYLHLQRSNRVYTNYSRGNRPLDMPDKSIRLYLYDKNGAVLFPLKKYRQKEQAKEDAVFIAEKVGLPLR